MKTTFIFFTRLTKGKKLSLLVAPLVALILSMKTLLLGLAILIFLDLLTGVRKYHFINKIAKNPLKKVFWKGIKSYLLRDTWRKAYEYGIGIVVVIIFESLIFGITTISILNRDFTISELAIIIPAVIEIWSIFENLEAVSNENILKKSVKILPRNIQRLFNNNENTYRKKRREP